MEDQTHSEITEYQMSYWAKLLHLREKISRKQSYLPWEHQISNSQTIPWRVFEKPVLTSTIVNKYH